MDIDQDLRTKIIDTYVNMTYLRKHVEDHDNELKELKEHLDEDVAKLRESHDVRLRDLERNQSKIMAYVVLIGSGITIALNWLFSFGEKLHLWK